MRLTSIQKAFPNAVILIPFRDPLQQSLSLWHQHLKFVEEHKKNKFAKSYMTWLVHHEFGEDHRFFDVASRKSSKSLDDPGYWLDQWIHVYGYLLRVAYENKLNLIFINYEELCDYPDIVWKSLSSLSGIDSDILPGGFTLNKAPQRSWRSYEGTNEQEARDIYDELTSKFKKAIQEPLR